MGQKSVSAARSCGNSSWSFGEITSIDANRVEIQIQKMAVENEMTEEMEG